MKTLNTLTAIILFLMPNVNFGQLAPDLGLASTFALFTANGAFNNTGATVIFGDIGTDVGALNGFPPGVVFGQIYMEDDFLSSLVAIDVDDAYSYLDGITTCTVIGNTTLDNQILGPGAYCFGAEVVLSANGVFTLDGQNDPNSLFFILIDGALSTGSLSDVVLINEANVCNVYWQVNGQVELGANSFFRGTIVANGAIILLASVDLIGRGLSRAGAISTNANFVDLPLSCLCSLDVTCPPADGGTFQCISQIPAGMPSDITINSSCGPTTVDISNSSTGTGSTASPYVSTDTYTVTDTLGNVATCTVTYTAVDNTPPVITCPQDVTIECDVSTEPNIFGITGYATATDNCAPSPQITANDITLEGACPQEFTITRNWIATDDAGNISSCTQIITVVDNTPPLLTCPGGVTVQCANQVPTPDITLVTSTDNCGVGTITHVGDVTVNQTCPNRYTLNRTYRATDECGNSATCNQTITVFDNTIPTLTCPVPVTVQCASQVPAANTGSVTSSDNCGGATTVTLVSNVTVNQTCPNRYTLNRTYRATDLCGNSAICIQVITVFDNIPPSITCPANVTVSCASLVPAVNTSLVVTSDNCSGTAVVTHAGDVITNQTCANRFILTRTYRSTDVCGNTALCAQVITVFDNSPPVITFTNPLLAGVPNGGTVEVQCFGQNPDWDLPTFDASSVNATDNCTGTVTVTFSQVLQDEGNCKVDGYINLYRLTWTATDVCGNNSSAFVFLALIDIIPPVINGVPADITVNCDEIPGPPALVYAIDECLCACVILLEETDPAPGCQDGQVIVRSWTARDRCGNETIETQNITLVDDAGPELQIMQPEIAGMPDGTILEYTCNEGGIPEFFDLLNENSVSGPVSCGGSTIISFDSDNIVSNNCEYFGYVEQRTFHWEGVDPCGNETNLTIIARVIDNEAPVLIGVPDTTCIGDPSLRDVDATDNCGHPFLRFRDTNIPNPCGDGMAVQRTYEAYDDCGNMSIGTAILIPNDQTHPIIEFVNPDIEPGEVMLIDCAANDGQFTSFGVNDVTVVDACMLGRVTVNFTERVIESHDCSTNGIVAILELEWTATDICGNLSVLQIQAFVIDDSNPVFVNFKREVTIGCNDEMPQIFATDNCGGVSITTTETIVPGPCAFEYVVRRLVTATDPCGNSTTELQTIHVGDGSGPIIEGVEEVICDDLSIPEVTAYDACAEEFVEVTMEEDTLDIPCRGDGMVIERTWTAVGICGNVTVIHQTIIINDQTPPGMLIPSYSVIHFFMDNEHNLILLSQTDLIKKLNALDENSVFVLDDCDQEIIPVFTVEITYADDCNADGFFEHRDYTWVATDVCGNVATLSFSVDIMDDIPPVFTEVPGDITIICVPLPPVPEVQADDPAQEVTIVFTESIDQGEGPGVYIVTRKWVATDACGNSSVAIQRITWIPDTFIECDIILPESVECNSHGVIIRSDVTGGFGPYTYVWEIAGEKCFIQGGQGGPEITIYIGWSDVKIILTVTDAFGCVSMCMIILECIESSVMPIAVFPSFIDPETNSEHNVTNAHSVLNNEPGEYLKQLNLWPNPANGNVNLSFESAIDQEIQFTLTNFLGQDVLSDQIIAYKGFNTHKIGVSQIPEGSYLMQVKSEREIYTKVVVVLRND